MALRLNEINSMEKIEWVQLGRHSIIIGSDVIGGIKMTMREQLEKQWKIGWSTDKRRVDLMRWDWVRWRSILRSRLVWTMNFLKIKGIALTVEPEWNPNVPYQMEQITRANYGNAQNAKT